jgi:hypothetical protein
MVRRAYEGEILATFDDVVNRLNLSSITFRRRTRDNRITLCGRVDFEFGDLRVNLKACHVIAEAELRRPSVYLSAEAFQMCHNPREFPLLKGVLATN